MPAPLSPSAPPLALRLLRLAVVLALAAALVAQVNPVSAAVPGTVGSASSSRLDQVADPVLPRPGVVRWDPCTVIGYRVDAALAGRQALDATGLRGVGRPAGCTG